ncbi:MAG: amidase, partial [Alphaproteobacteria bacterium]
MAPAQNKAFTVEAAEAAIREGRITSEEMVEACLSRVDEVDSRVEAWAFLDRDHALAQARRADRARQEGEPLGRLHGIPVGIKDIFDTADMPTEDGTVLHAGRQPTVDSMAVALLREAGAVIMGKTVTTELAVYSPGKTRNPHDPERTPGGSSSGSAAAVAAGMVPLAIGSQTNGSVIRPAAFCGVVGIKPTYGRISLDGVMPFAPTLDHAGTFTRTVPS